MLSTLDTVSRIPASAHEAATVIKEAYELYLTIQHQRAENDFTCIQYYLQGKHSAPKDLHLQG